MIKKCDVCHIEKKCKEYTCSIVDKEEGGAIVGDFMYVCDDCAEIVMGVPFWKYFEDNTKEKERKVSEVVKVIVVPMYYNLMKRIQRIEKDVFGETWEEFLEKPKEPKI